MPTRRGQYRPAVIDLCSVGGLPREFTAKAIAGRIGHSSKILPWLKRHGHVAAAGRGRYTLTRKGEKMAQRACAVRRR